MRLSIYGPDVSIFESRNVAATKCRPTSTDLEGSQRSKKSLARSFVKNSALIHSIPTKEKCLIKI